MAGERRVARKERVKITHKAEDFEEVPILRRLSEVPRREVQFLWEPYLPLGKVCFLDGVEGLGKTSLALEIAARVTTGRPLPGQDGEREPRNVVYMTLEDDPEEKFWDLVERFGGDPGRIVLLEGYRKGREHTGQFTLDQVHVLGNAIVQTEAVLVFIDPFLAHLPRGRRHCDGAREVMTGLIQQARRYQTTIAGIRHLTKDGKVRGPVEINAAARSTLLIGKDGSGHRVIAHSKSNCAQAGPSRLFDLDDEGFQWLGESDLTPQDLLRKEKPKPRPIWGLFPSLGR